MKINRRDLLVSGGISLLAGSRAFGQSTGATPPPTHSPAIDARARRLLEALQRNRLVLRGLESNTDLIRTIYGYDAAVIWKGAHASSGLE